MQLTVLMIWRMELWKRCFYNILLNGKYVEGENIMLKNDKNNISSYNKKFAFYIPIKVEMYGRESNNFIVRKVCKCRSSMIIKGEWLEKAAFRPCFIFSSSFWVCQVINCHICRECFPVFVRNVFQGIPDLMDSTSFRPSVLMPRMT